MLCIKKLQTNPNILKAVLHIREFGVEPIEEITGNFKNFCGDIGEVEPILLSEVIDFAQNFVKNKTFEGRYRNSGG